MDSTVVEKLEEFGLEEFIDVYQFYLCEKTVSPNQIAVALNFDADQCAIINDDSADSFSKNEKLYELIQNKVQVKDFLEALNETANEHIIKFIKETELSASAQTTSANPNPSQSPGIWFNLPEPNESFCGREDFLSQLHDQLKPRDDSETEVTVLSQVKIVSGLGEIGKTQTARKFISQYFECYNNFIWIDAENENSLTNSFLKLAEEIKIPVKNSEGKSKEIDEIVKEIYNKICDGGKSNLIVFDNAEDYSSCRQFFPFGLHPDLTKPVILATSRNQEWKSTHGKIQVLPLDKMTEDESLEFILKQLEIPESEIPEFKEESKEFIELIGGLPLALQQAVAFIKQEKELRKFLTIGKSHQLSNYAQEFKSSMKRFLSVSPVPVPALDSSHTVLVTWNAMFDAIQKLENGEVAVKMLKILSFLYADKIPSTFLHDLVPEIKDEEFSGALKLLEKFSLITINPTYFCLSIHRQLQFVILQYLKECDDVSNVVMNIVEKCTAVLENIKLSESYDIFLNVHQIVNHRFNLIPVTEKFLDFMYDFGFVLSRASRYSESLDLYEKVYSNSRDLLGEDHEETLTAQNLIALQLSNLGRYDEALFLNKEILEKQENHPHFGVDHPKTIPTKHRIATILKNQGKFQESLELFKQALAQQNKIHGENHPSTLTTQNQIASVHYDLGNFSKASNLYEELEKKQTEILGSDNREVLTTKHNKASVLFKMRKFEEASKIFNEIYEIEKESLGETHVDTINTLELIAMSLKREGKFTEAFEIFQKVYEIRKTNFGENHPDTIDIKRRIADLETKLREQSVQFQATMLIVHVETVLSFLWGRDAKESHEKETVNEKRENWEIVYS